MNNVSFVDREKLIWTRARQHWLFWLAVSAGVISWILNFMSGYGGQKDPVMGVIIGVLLGLSVVLGIFATRFSNWKGGATALAVVPMALGTYLICSLISTNATLELFSKGRGQQDVVQAVRNNGYENARQRYRQKSAELQKFESLNSLAQGHRDVALIAADIEAMYKKPLARSGKPLKLHTRSCTRNVRNRSIRHRCRQIAIWEKELVGSRVALANDADRLARIDRLQKEVGDLQTQMLTSEANEGGNVKLTIIQKLRPDWKPATIALYDKLVYSILIQFVLDIPWWIIFAVVTREVKEMGPREVQAQVRKINLAVLKKLAFWKRWSLTRVEEARDEFGGFVEDAVEDVGDFAHSAGQRVQVAYDAAMAPPVAQVTQVADVADAPGGVQAVVSSAANVVPMATPAPAPVVKTAVDKARLSQLEQFRAAALIMGGGEAQHLPRDQVYQAYVGWARSLGQPAMMLQDFARYMKMILTTHINVATGEARYVNVSFMSGFGGGVQ